jgi:hypothetical protein
MKEVTEAATVARIRRLMDALLRYSQSGTITVKKIPGWVAAPMPSGAHLSVDDQARIIATAKEHPSTRLWAIALENVRNIAFVFSVDTSVDDLRAFNRRLNFLNYAFAATDAAVEKIRWVVACSTDDFLIALGPRAAVEAILGDSLTNGFSRFHSYASDVGWQTQTREILYGVEAALALYNIAAPGTEIVV